MQEIREYCDKVIRSGSYRKALKNTKWSTSHADKILRPTRPIGYQKVWKEHARYKKLILRGAGEAETAHDMARRLNKQERELVHGRSAWARVVRFLCLAKYEDPIPRDFLFQVFGAFDIDFEVTTRARACAEELFVRNTRLGVAGARSFSPPALAKNFFNGYSAKEFTDLRYPLCHKSDFLLVAPHTLRLFDGVKDLCAAEALPDRFVYRSESGNGGEPQYLLRSGPEQYQEIGFESYKHEVIMQRQQVNC